MKTNQNLSRYGSHEDGCPLHASVELSDETHAMLTEDDWADDVRQGNTKLGLDDWREHNRESERPPESECTCGYSESLIVASAESVTWGMLQDALRLCQSALTDPPGNGAKEYQAGQAAKAALAHAKDWTYNTP